MPAKSRSQYRFMKAVEGGYINPEKLSADTAREFTKGNTGSKKFSKLKERLRKKD